MPVLTCPPVPVLQSPSVAKVKADRALQKVGELIQSSPSILSSKGLCSLCFLEVEMFFLFFSVMNKKKDALLNNLYQNSISNTFIL